MMTTGSVLKQFGEWVIVWRSKFLGDIFLRTTIYIVGLQIGLVIISIAAFSWALHYTNQQIVNTMITHFTALLLNNNPSFQAQSLPNSIQAIQTQTVQYVFAGVVTIAALFGMLLAYLTLRPTRTSLEYQKLFMSNVAHELRTPLSTIKTSTEVALLDNSLSPELQQTLTQTVSELDRASEIINNLLSLNRLLRPERMEFSNVDLGPIIDTVTERLSGLAQEHNIEIVTKKNDYRTVWGNATALEQVVTNIIKNAISYTGKGRHGVVSISVAPDYRGSVVFSVADNGIGISKKDLFHIFEPFYRADLSRVRNIEKSGSGLGLAIVNEITRAHSGKIHIQSALGKGTTVSIVFPAGATPSGEIKPIAEKSALSEVSIDFSKRM